MKSHQQLVEEWKRNLRELIRKDLETNPDTLLADCIDGLIIRLEQAMLAAAKGAAEAGKLGKYQFKLEDYFKEV